MQHPGNSQLAGSILAGLLLSTGAYAAAPAQPATLGSLESSAVEIHKSQAPTVDPQTVLDNYTKLLAVTDNPEQRLYIMRRLADAELVVAIRGNDHPRQRARHAIVLYRKLLKSSIYKNQREQLLYSVARACDIAGDTAGVITSLTRLISNYPASRYTAEAHFRRAETRFVLHSYTRAAQDYNWLIDNGKDSPFLLQARYKLAWANYKLSHFRESLTEFGAVLKSMLGTDGVGPDNKLKIAALSQSKQAVAIDSLRGIILDFANLGDSFTPGDYVKASGMEAYTYLFYNKLYKHYLDKQRFTDASRLAIAFVSDFPDSPHMHSFELRAIQALEAGGFQRAALQRNADFVQRYGVKHHDWNDKDPLQIPAVRKRLHRYLDQIAQARVARAQKTQKPSDFVRVADWYATYLQVFPDSSDAAKLVYLRAQALEHAGQYANAATIYARVAYAMGANKYATDAGYAAVLDRRKAAGKTVATDPAVFKATLRFALAYPTDPKSGKVLARLAGDRYRAGDIDGADQLAKLIIAHRPQPDIEQLTTAWHIRVVAAQQAGNYQQVEIAARWLLQNGSQQQSAKLQKLLAAAIYKQGQQLVDADKDGAARKQFLRLIASVAPGPGPAASIRAAAMYDAAAASVRMGDKAAAINLLKQFRSQYPGNTLTPKATRKLAALYLDTGDKASAADIFSIIRNQPGLDAATRRAAALRTAQLRAATGQIQAAARAYETYLQGYNVAFDAAMDARAQLVKLNTRLGNTSRTNYWRRQIIQADAAASAQRSERSRTLAAQASLALADKARIYFEQIQLTMPLKPALQAKQDGLKAALQTYGQAADYGIAEVTTAATFHIGQMFYAFSKALLGSPLPSGLSAPQTAQYKALLQQQAMPFEEKAIRVQQSNMARILQGIRNSWTRKSLAQLAELELVRYGKQEQLNDTLVPTP